MNRWLAALVAAAMVVLPVVPALHRIFASHDHLYCVEHHVFEDLPPGSDAAAHRDAERRRGLRFDAGQEVARRTHLACGSLNHTLPSLGHPHERTPAAGGPPLIDEKPVTRLPGASWLVLGRAPKHSPPPYRV